MSTARKYRPTGNTWENARKIERVPDRIETKRHEAYMAVLNPIYDRAGRACKVKGQRHLRDFEVRS